MENLTLHYKYASLALRKFLLYFRNFNVILVNLIIVNLISCTLMNLVRFQLILHI